ncbi:DedA family protein [Conexibacter sp. SYSU D00693]|uniref:DedA family protein n=1 Tax=Conexibacter sp. SYSU D00693 TaxID=2812560 RepID=UPI001F11BEC3|nr:DedA family protein [Conexibacter sp. SYSU D00693]
MTAWAEDLLTGGGGYAVLAFLILVENLFPPIPSEVILPLAGAQVAAGDMSYLPAVLTATVGSVVGALVLYGIARFGGRAILLRWGRVLRLDHQRLDRADDWFDRHGSPIVFFGRLIPGVRSVVSVPAGLSEMPLARFVGLTTAGSLLWNAALIGGGWALGEQWRDVSHAVEDFDLLLVGSFVVAMAAFVVWRHRRVRRRRTADALAD